MIFFSKKGIVEVKKLNFIFTKYNFIKVSRLMADQVSPPGVRVCTHGRVCSTPGCHKGIKKDRHSYCPECYKKWINGGDENSNPCKISGCPNMAIGNHPNCSSCYQKSRRYLGGTCQWKFTTGRVCGKPVTGKNPFCPECYVDLYKPLMEKKIPGVSSPGVSFRGTQMLDVALGQAAKLQATATLDACAEVFTPSEEKSAQFLFRFSERLKQRSRYRQQLTLEDTQVGWMIQVFGRDTFK